MWWWWFAALMHMSLALFSGACWYFPWSVWADVVWFYDCIMDINWVSCVSRAHMWDESVPCCACDCVGCNNGWICRVCECSRDDVTYLLPGSNERQSNTCQDESALHTSAQGPCGVSCLRRRQRLTASIKCWCLVYWDPLHADVLPFVMAYVYGVWVLLVCHLKGSGTYHVLVISHTAFV